jgi:hypothetical protein
MLGRNRKDIISNPLVIGSILYPDDRDYLFSLHNKSRRQLIPYSWEGRILVKKRIVWIRVEACPRKLENGDVLWVCMVYNITEHITMKETLDETLVKLYKTVNTLKDQETPSEENDQRVKDIMLVFRKISKYIKDQLTQEEKTIFGEIQNSIGTAASNASKSIEGSIGASTTQTEPEEETDETE